MGDVVRRTGTIFRCGNYADKGFALDATEARAAIAAFTPVPVDLEHTSTVLDNRLGTLEAVEMHADGETLVGTVVFPKWLDDLLDDGTRKVSATWDRATKTLKGLAIVNTPRVNDAVLMAAFSGTEEGRNLVSVEAEFAGKRHSERDQSLIERGHKMAHAIAGVFVGLGAPEGSAQEEAGETPATEAAETTAGMRKGVLGMTDEKKARTFGEKFAAWFNGEDVTPDDRAAVEARFAVAVPPDDDVAVIDQISRLLGRLRTSETAEGDKDDLALIGQISAMLSRLRSSEAREDAGASATTKSKATMSMTDPEKDAMRREIARLRERDVERDAAAFADGEVAAKRALPGERAALVAEFTQAAHDDLANPATVTFSVGDETKQGSRVDAVRARHAIRLPHRLTEELVKNLDPDEHMVLMSAMTTKQAGEEGTPTEARLKQLREASALGRATREKK